MVSKVCLKIKRKNSDINVVITNVDRSLSTDSESFVVDEGDILTYAKEYNEAYKDTYNWLISKNHMSTYDIHTHEIEKHTMISPICCTFRLPAEREMVALDINKAYTSNLMDMEKFPCFNAFDKYQVYDDHEIEDYTMYYIRALKSNDATAILFGSTYSRAYGYKLNRIDRKLFEILSFKRPSNLLETHSKDKIQKLYDTKHLSKDSKKQIINVLLGLMEKKVNKKSNCKLFLTKEEAQYYIDEYGGKLGHLSHYVDIPDDESEGCLFATGNQKEEIIYSVVLQKDKELVDGFLPIKEMIYDIQRYKLYKMFRKCKAHNIEVHGIKTDCVLVKASDDYHLWSAFEKDLGDNIGQYKLEHGKSLFGERLRLQENENESELLTKMETQELVLRDEYDRDEIGRLNDT